MEKSEDKELNLEESAAQCSRVEGCGCQPNRPLRIGAGGIGRLSGEPRLVTRPARTERRTPLPKQAPHIIPALRYRDAPAAIDFLVKAFGFAVNARHDGDDGRVEHAQLTFGDGMVMLGSQRDDAWTTGKSSIYVIVDDPDAHHDTASAAGAEIVMPLTDQDYGSRDYAALDPEGNIWSFGTYHPEM